jgi:aldose 1-epimerase
MLMALSLPMAAQYSVEKQTVDGAEVYLLRDARRDMAVRVVPALGFNAYDMTVHGKAVMWSPYSTLGELLKKPAHAGNPFLWPWANRIDGMSYPINGKKYSFNPDLGNVRPGPRNTPIHGLVTFTDRWRVTAARGGAGEAVLEGKLEFWRYPDWMAQFPFANTVTMTYRLRDGALAVETAVENLSSEPLPLSLGYHPYFKLSDSPRDQWQVTLAASEKMVLDDRLLPTGEKQPSPYASPLKLEGVSLDDVLTGLKRDADGWARFVVEGQREKLTVEYGPHYPVAVVYSPKGRGFICFEPMTAPTNAFHGAQAGWYKELQSVSPGATWRETFRIRPDGF